MNSPVEKAVSLLSGRLGTGFPHRVKFEIDGAGTVILDADGVREGSGEADCVLSADAETFKDIVSGELDATAAYMSGRLRVGGNLDIAVQLGNRLR